MGQFGGRWQAGPLRDATGYARLILEAAFLDGSRMSREATSGSVRGWGAIPPAYRHGQLDHGRRSPRTTCSPASSRAMPSRSWAGSRILGYNLLSTWRAQAPSKDRLPLSWSRCMELLRDAFMLNSHGASPAIIA